MGLSWLSQEMEITSLTKLRADLCKADTVCSAREEKKNFFLNTFLNKYKKTWIYVLIPKT